MNLTIDDRFEDMLKEAANIGSGRAVNSLSLLLGEPVSMKPVQLTVVSFQELISEYGDKEEVMAASLLPFSGDLKGIVYLLFSQDDINALAGSLIGRSVTMKELETDPYMHSMLMELGNILSGAYISALADFTSLNIQTAAPSAAVDMAVSLWNEGLTYTQETQNEVLFLESEWKSVSLPGGTASGRFLFLPDALSFQVLLRRLEEKIND